jgi:hypothetical protein
MTDERRWFESHDNVVTLTAWMAENGQDAREVAAAVEKPWKYEDFFRQAMAEQDAEADAAAAARDTAEVDRAFSGRTEFLTANDPCPAAEDGQHSWEPDRDVPNAALRSGDGLHCEECGVQTVYDRYGPDGP